MHSSVSSIVMSQSKGEVVYCIVWVLKVSSVNI